MKEIYNYAKERFPILPALLFSSLFGFAGIAHISGFRGNAGQIIASAAMIFLFLLRIRLWDEIKDFYYDSKHHSSRPIQMGVLSLLHIKKAALVVLGIEIMIQFFLPYQAVTIFFIALLYSFLMFKNFYIKDFENKSFLLWLLSHQLIFLIYIYYIFSIGSTNFFSPKTQSDIWMMLSLFLPTLIYEIGRKVKHRISSAGYNTDDTYIYRWGETKSYIFLFFLFYFQALSTFMIFHHFSSFYILQILAILIATLFYFISRKRAIATSNKWSIALGMYGFLVLSFYFI